MFEFLKNDNVFIFYAVNTNSPRLDKTDGCESGREMMVARSSVTVRDKRERVFAGVLLCFVCFKGEVFKSEKSRDLIAPERKEVVFDDLRF